MSGTWVGGLENIHFLKIEHIYNGCHNMFTSYGISKKSMNIANKRSILYHRYILHEIYLVMYKCNIVSTKKSIVWNVKAVWN